MVQGYRISVFVISDKERSIRERILLARVGL
jgi:hypothetical protein